MTTDELLQVIAERGLTVSVGEGKVMLCGAEAKSTATARLLRVVRHHHKEILERFAGDVAVEPAPPMPTIVRRPKHISTLPITAEPAPLLAQPDGQPATEQVQPVSTPIREFRLASGRITEATLDELADRPGNYPLFAEGWRWKGEAEWRPVVLCGADWRTIWKPIERAAS